MEQNEKQQKNNNTNPFLKRIDSIEWFLSALFVIEQSLPLFAKHILIEIFVCRSQFVWGRDRETKQKKHNNKNEIKPYSLSI